MFKLIVLGVVYSICFINCERVRYNNYALYKILPENLRHIEILQELHEAANDFEFWSSPSVHSEFVSVLSKPSSRNDLEAFLGKHDIKFQVANSNIQDAIDKERKETINRNTNASMTWDAYYDLDGIYNWLDSLVTSYPDRVSSLVAGTSFEGRQIKGIKISSGPGRKIIFVEGGIHSREWISPSTVCYIAEQIIRAENNETLSAANDYDWYIFPVTNPDGYVYSFESDRMWRKNRRPVRTSVGVDLNRNFNSNWMVVGASSNAAAQDFAGTGPFSEPETRELSTFIRNIGDEIDLFLSFHSFSQYLLIPFGNTTAHLANYHDAMIIGNATAEALSRRYGTRYTVGNIAVVIYHATGGSIDWVKEQLKVPLVYCYELRDTGANGFLLPTNQILPNNEETMDSILKMIEQAKELGYLEPSYSCGVKHQASFVALFVACLVFLLKQ